MIARVNESVTDCETAEQFVFSGDEFDTDTMPHYHDKRHFDPAAGQVLSTEPCKMINAE